MNDFFLIVLLICLPLAVSGATAGFRLFVQHPGRTPADPE